MRQKGGQNLGAVRRTTMLTADVLQADEYLRPCGHRLSGDESGFSGALASKADAFTGINRADTASEIRTSSGKPSDVFSVNHSHGDPSGTLFETPSVPRCQID